MDSQVASRLCRNCGTVKPLEDFNRDRSGKYGRQTMCRDCYRTYTKNRYASKREEIRGRQRESRFGISPEEFAARLEAQEGRCALCGEVETHTWRGKIRQLCVDHHHETGAVRGLLCSNCNRALGLLRDDPELMLRAAEYVQRGGNG